MKGTVMPEAVIDHGAIVAQLRQHAAEEFKNTLSRGTDLSAYDDFEFHEVGIEGWMEDFANRLTFLDDISGHDASAWVVCSYSLQKYLVLTHDTVYEIDLQQWGSDTQLRIAKVVEIDFFHLPRSVEDRVKLLSLMAR